MIRAVLFDLDGTLVNARAAWDAALDEALALGRARYPELQDLGDGQRVQREVLRPLLEHAHREAGSGEWSPDFVVWAFDQLLKRHARPDAELADLMRAHYEAAWPRHLHLFPEVPAVLEQLTGCYRLGLVSNGLEQEQRIKIAPLGLDRYLETVAISGELGIRKPDPAIFRHALAALGVSASEAIHVGDDFGADIEGARAAGLAAGIWVNREGTSDSSASAGTRAAVAHIEVADLADLASLVATL